MSVLVIDDVKVNRLTLMRAIAPLPSIEAADAAEGLQQFYAHNPALVLLDLGLPQVDGVTVLKLIRMHDDRCGSRTPVVVVTGEGTPERVREAMQLDIQGFFVKPVDNNALAQTVRALWPKTEPA